jgi:hypothetical protein
MSEIQNEQTSDSSPVIDLAVELLGNSDILTAVTNFNSDTNEKELALEFVKSYALYIQELVAHDFNLKLNRSDIEIRDLVSHVNIMMKKKYEPAFNAIALHSPAHYRSIQNSILAGSDDSAGK